MIPLRANVHECDRASDRGPRCREDENEKHEGLNEGKRLREDHQKQKQEESMKGIYFGKH